MSKKTTTRKRYRYTYGKPVKGKLTAVLCLEKKHWREALKLVCHNETRDVPVCTIYNFSTNFFVLTRLLDLPEIFAKHVHYYLFISMGTNIYTIFTIHIFIYLHFILNIF